MTPADTSPVEREVGIRARPQTIFPFFTDPELMIRWIGTSVDVDPRPGGIYRVDIDGSHVARGEYVEIAAAGGDSGPDPWAERATADAD